MRIEHINLKKIYKSKEELEEALADTRKFLKEEIIYDDGNDLAIISEKEQLKWEV